MSYTTPWDSSNPPGSTLANQIDNVIRTFRQQLEERLEDVLIEDITDDPWILKAPASGAVTAKKMIVPAYAFDGGTIQTDGSKLYNASDPATRAALILPNGAIIKGVRWLVKNGAASGPVSLLLRSQFFGTGSVPSLDVSLSKAIAGQEIITSPTLTIPIDSTERWYWLEADQTSTGTFQIYAVEISYNTPDSRNTI